MFDAVKKHYDGKSGARVTDVKDDESLLFLTSLVTVRLAAVTFLLTGYSLGGLWATVMTLVRIPTFVLRRTCEIDETTVQLTVLSWWGGG